MASINKEKLSPYLNSYKKYLAEQQRGVNDRPLEDIQENYKRRIIRKAVEALNLQSWQESEIGQGSIGECSIKAIQKNHNLISRFQVSLFSDKVRKDYSVSERVMYDLYHERKDQDCFEKLCGLFGRKYDLISYLYFILDPNMYLPLRPAIFDNIFNDLGIVLKTSGRCSWENYQEFLATLSSVRDTMNEYFNTEDFDLLDAHSFLWTINEGALKATEEETIEIRTDLKATEEHTIEIGTDVYHKDYGSGLIIKITENKIYIDFAGKQRIFPYPKALKKGYLKLGDGTNEQLAE